MVQIFNNFLKEVMIVTLRGLEIINKLFLRHIVKHKEYI